MKIYNNTVMSRWPTAGYALRGGTVGGSTQDSYACRITPSRTKTAYFGDSNGKSTTAYLRNRIGGKLLGPALAGSFFGTGDQDKRRFDRHCHRRNGRIWGAGCIIWR